MLKVSLLSCLICLPGVKFQACDLSSESTQCSEGEICRYYNFETATQCQSASSCFRSGEGCVTDYCQQYSCTTAGQCVHGQRCSHNSIRKCVYFKHIVAEEGSQVGIPITEPAVTGSYEEIWWYRHRHGESSNRIVLLHPSSAEGLPLYSPEYCSQSASCNKSDKVSLNTRTGELTIYNVSLADDDYYSYQFYAPDGASDTGHKYETFLEVYVVPAPEITASAQYVKPGDPVRLECKVNHIKPEAREIHWTINGNKTSGTNSWWRYGDGTFANKSVIIHTFTLDELDKIVKCTVIPNYGSSVTTKIALKYAPHGSPTVSPEQQKKYGLQQVVLTCDTNTIGVGNPRCQTWTWRKIDGTVENIVQGKNILEFIMEEQDAGNYTCKCGNEFGETDFSEPSELVFLPGTPPEESASWTKIAIIAGSASGILIIIFAIAVVVVVLRKRYICIRKEPEITHASTRSESLYYINAEDPYIQRYETPETILEEDIEDGSYLRPVIVNGKLVLNKPEKKPPGDRNKHIYENEQGFVNQVRNNYVNVESTGRQTDNRSIAEVKANGTAHDYFDLVKRY